MREEAPTVFLFQTEYIYAMNKKVQNFVPRPDGNMPLDEIQRLR